MRVIEDIVLIMVSNLFFLFFFFFLGVDGKKLEILDGYSSRQFPTTPGGGHVQSLDEQHLYSQHPHPHHQQQQAWRKWGTESNPLSQEGERDYNHSSKLKSISRFIDI